MKMRLFLLEPSLPHCAGRNPRHCCRSFFHVSLPCARTGHRRKLEASRHNVDEAEGCRGDGHHHHGGLHLCILRHGLLCDISEAAPLGPLVTGASFVRRRGSFFLPFFAVSCYVDSVVECKLRQEANVNVRVLYIHRSSRGDANLNVLHTLTYFRPSSGNVETCFTTNWVVQKLCRRERIPVPGTMCSFAL